ncbi:MAG TPA: histidine--tRNA ligase [Allosphingosinicella sp.]|nr:histidine--tRNA ligase [Allosphingosinicella sp.]
MSKGPQRVRGTQDIWGEDSDRFQTVVAAFERVRRLYGFGRVEMPVFESTAVFARSIGETTDIVSKEMYSFEDRGGDGLTLRPEFTAGICRAYLSEGWQQHAPIKIATHGPVFRYERPQKGRYRQFHQLDAEIIGAHSPSADVELLTFADQLLRELGISDGVTLQLNTLGDEETRASWRSALIHHFEKYEEDLSEDSHARLEKNPLRILDSKDPRDRPIIDTAPHIDMYLTADAASFFSEVTSGLDAAGVRWTRNSRLVRGLDYYRHTAFEFVTDRLGAQGAVIAGGRYDGLMESLGGPLTPAVGWAAGIERLAMLIDQPQAKWLETVVVIESEDLDGLATGLVAAMRRKGIQTELVASGSIKKRFDKAVKLNPAYILSLNSNILEPGQLAAARRREIFVPQRDSSRILAALDAVFHETFDLNGTSLDEGEASLFPRSPR